MTNKELIAEAREACADKLFNRTYEAGLVRRLADALEASDARVKELEAQVKDFKCEQVFRISELQELLEAQQRIAELEAMLAAVPDVATDASGSSKTLADEYLELLHDMQTKYVKDTDILFLARKKAEAERDAALAAIERVKENLSLHNPNGRLVKEVLAALDGAPEPEWEYAREYRDEAGYPTIRKARDITTPDGHRSDGSPYWNYQVLRRRKAGPWLPVEGESK